MSQGRSIIPRPKRWDVPFSDEMTDDVVERILSVAPFNKIDRKKFRAPITLEGIIQNDARLVSCQEGDIIIREGDWGNSAFFILSGTVRVELMASGKFLPPEKLGRPVTKRKSLFRAIAQMWSNSKEPEFRDLSQPALSSEVGSRGSGDRTRIYLQDIPRLLDKYKTVALEAGELFGEIAALGRMPRTATVFAEGEATLVEFRWQGLREIFRKDASMRTHIETKFRNNALEGILRNEPSFANTAEEDMQQLLDQAEFNTFATYDLSKQYRDMARGGTEGQLTEEPLVAKEGDYPNGVTLICSGLARLSQRYHNGHRTLGYLLPGQMYGFPEIEEGWKTQKQLPLSMSLRAIGYLTTVTVPTQLVERLVLEKGGAGKSHQSPALDVAAAAQTVTNIGSDIIEFAVDNSLVQGTATMIIDLDRCTRCDDCVRACSNAHDNNPRFLRHGPIHGQYMIANACMHCADPVCMIECPTGAISRDLAGGQVVISDQTCVGCTRCADNCSYDAIRMVEVRDGVGNLIRDENGRLPIQQATKCDLCVEQRIGPACQNACPHDALYRVNMTDLNSLGSVFNR
ncbi:MAG: cyclic nucleotide-binding domain-containing protein [Planctomycetaceae bacterium]|jgi:Fe-S-cluster-containing dehydrogenase component/CRP-like cAMP-binding protein|nr:cyclic nucleotide-binding domain-containing protein [Planctomycetaceae bacterium]MBT6486772.1 cyclic nucleotide-binding domain-containing protein [Planctomycetaceae bacterium]MBT6493383.1 cyclic nucleotide-binding domain-containing protein [Planctomycetaceae bacterium]